MKPCFMFYQAKQCFAFYLVKPSFTLYLTKLCFVFYLQLRCILPSNSVALLTSKASLCVYLVKQASCFILQQRCILSNEAVLHVLPSEALLHVYLAQCAFYLASRLAFYLTKPCFVAYALIVISLQMTSRTPCSFLNLCIYSLWLDANDGCCLLHA